MSRMYCLSAAFTGIVLSTFVPAGAIPTAQLAQDAGKVWAEAWFESASVGDRAQDRQEGPAIGGLAVDATTQVFDEWGLPAEVTASGRILPLRDDGDLGLYARVEPAGEGQGARGLARSEFAWQLAIGPEAVNFRVDLWATGGGSGLRLYDRTSGKILLDSGLYEGFGTSMSGRMEAGHVYELAGFAQADAARGGDPFAGLEFRSDASIVAVATNPEPASLVLLAVALAWRRRK